MLFGNISCIPITISQYIRLTKELAIGQDIKSSAGALSVHVDQGGHSN